jgi:murein DD-endopeptidase MepM/ murein hydrolase activator NlpD
VKVFPVDPSAHPTFADRFNGHKGTDIFAPRGSHVLAVDGGTARNTTDPKGGNVVYLKAIDGSTYYYAHLDDWAEPHEDNRPYLVRAGDLLGFVGSTGNAKDKPPHVHFEIHPAGSGAVNPFGELVELAPPGAVISDARPSPAKVSRKGQTSRASMFPIVLVVLAALALSRRRRRWN